MWVWTNDEGRGILVGDYGLSGAINVNFEKTADERLRLYWASVPDIYTNAIAMLGKWMHIAVARDKSTNKVYFYGDGKMIYQYDGALSDKTALIAHRIGRDSRAGGDTPFQGKLDDVRIYNQSLTSAQIEKIYVQGLERHRDLAKK